MTVHNLYLFDRNGVCLHYSEWHRKKQAGIPKEEVIGESPRTPQTHIVPARSLVSRPCYPPTASLSPSIADT